MNMNGHNYDCDHGRVRFRANDRYHALKLWQTHPAEYVCARYHVSERTLWRWKGRWDGSEQSLVAHYHAPNTPHPRAHTPEEIKHIKDVVHRHGDIGLNELYGILQNSYDYSRNPTSLYRVLRRLGYYQNRKARVPYKPKPYDTPTRLGEKWQLDVKYVPAECKAKAIPFDMRFYQYTIIDEASRKRFIFAYQEQTPQSTVDFVRRAVKFFGYKPKIIQTDNGSEFTYTRRTKDDREHIFDTLCRVNGIVHKLLRPRTPRHNGKVERSHRIDNERFYRNLKFYSYEDLQRQMTAYLQRSNNIPSRVLQPREGKRRWLSPNEKERELMAA